jgi:hypothetical protein
MWEKLALRDTDTCENGGGARAKASSWIPRLNSCHGQKIMLGYSIMGCSQSLSQHPSPVISLPCILEIIQGVKFSSWMSTSTSDWNKTSFSIQVMRRVLHGEYDFRSGRVLSLQNGAVLAIIKRTNKSFEVYRVESNYKRDSNPRPNFQKQKKCGYLYLYALVSSSGRIFMVNYLLVIDFGFIEWCTCVFLDYSTWTAPSIDDKCLLWHWACRLHHWYWRISMPRWACKRLIRVSSRLVLVHPCDFCFFIQPLTIAALAS